MMQAFIEQLPFPLDDFQQEAIQVIDQGESVVVCAPTGSGKTIIAEFAATKALEQGVKLFYTTPLKALSNQKYFDFKERFGEQNVGLLTGDLTINREARLVVMTTEVFRNMLYGLNEDSPLLNKVGYAVLDECHFMNDAERGTVWEESIIYCPESIQLIALSATVANAQELTDWINQVHHRTRLVHSDFRPVPLRFSYYNREKILPLFEAPGRLNQKLKFDTKNNRMSKDVKGFRPNDLIAEMQEKEMLPAIFFTFSRKGCDKYLRDTRDLKLLTPEERQIIREKIDAFLIQHPFLQDNPMLPFIANGFASHHAGLLPGLKLLVESLFQQGLIKAVFATETLAAGINMPARSTVITSISKRTGEGHRLLTASEFLQMSGRAGRRGMDSVGYVIIVSSPYRGAQDAATLASSPADGLNSQFTPTYGMVLNLLQKFTLDEVQFLVQKSFGQFTAERRLYPLEREIEQKTAELQHYIEFQCPAGVTDQDFHGFLKAKALLSEAHRFVHSLKRDLKKHGDSPEIQEELRRAVGKRDNLNQTVETSPCKTCNVLKEHQQSEEQVRRLQKYLKSLNTVHDREKDLYWRNFSSLYNLLKEEGCLLDDNRPSPLGQLTSQLRTENELFMAKIITQGHFDTLAPHELAGVLCALVTDSNKDNIITKCATSPNTLQAFTAIEKELKRIKRLQDKYNVLVPLNLNPIATPLVEAWVQGMSWEPLMESTNLDAGDMVRMVRRTADVLRQLTRIPEVSTELALTARQALKGLYRDPIKEVDITEEETAPLIPPTPEAELPAEVPLLSDAT